MGAHSGSGTDKASFFNNNVTIFSFILTILVILVHAENQYILVETGTLVPGFKLMDSVESFFGDGLGAVAVPGFFFISGYLFCRSFERRRIGTGDIWQKWKKRIYSLVLPYLIWNLIYYLIYLAAGRAEMSLSELGEALLNYAYNPVFWYMQQLIILSVLAPFVYSVFNDGGVKAGIFVLALIFIVAANYSPEGIHVVNEDALFYYCCGIVSVLFFKDTFEESSNKSYIIALSFIGVFAAASMFCVMLGGLVPVPVYAGAVILRRICGAIGIWFLLLSLRAGKDGTRGFMHISFFVYATHYLIIRGINQLLPTSSAVLLLIFFMMPLICIAAAYGLSLILRRILPRAYRLICGGREG